MIMVDVIPERVGTLIRNSGPNQRWVHTHDDGLLLGQRRLQIFERLLTIVIQAPCHSDTGMAIHQGARVLV
ncbi:hypothetical protein BCA37_25380 [Mycobacterium sp. djl-10]|nr:hypothetical protein BCA37_25380 [Mycobacterium sp. djl-10]